MEFIDLDGCEFFVAGTKNGKVIKAIVDSDLVKMKTGQVVADDFCGDKEIDRSILVDEKVLTIGESTVSISKLTEKQLLPNLPERTCLLLNCDKPALLL